MNIFTRMFAPNPNALRNKLLNKKAMEVELSYSRKELKEKKEEVRLILSKVLIKMEAVFGPHVIEFPEVHEGQKGDGSGLEIISGVIKVNLEDLFIGHEVIKQNIPNLSLENYLAAEMSHELNHSFQRKKDYKKVSTIVNKAELENSADFGSGAILRIVYPDLTEKEVGEIAHLVFLMGNKKDVYLKRDSVSYDKFRENQDVLLEENGHNSQSARRQLFMRGFNSFKSLEQIIDTPFEF